MTNTTTTVTCDMCGSLISRDGHLIDLNADRFTVIKKAFILNRERKIDLCSRCIETIMNAGEERQDESVKHYGKEEVAMYCLRRVEDFSWVFRDRNDNLKYGHQKGQHHGRK